MYFIILITYFNLLLFLYITYLQLNILHKSSLNSLYNYYLVKLYPIPLIYHVPLFFISKPNNHLFINIYVILLFYKSICYKYLNNSFLFIQVNSNLYNHYNTII